jgi:hypothetical protein
MRLFAQTHRQCGHTPMKLLDLRLHLALAEN